MSSISADLRPVNARRREWTVPNRSFTLIEMLVVIAIIAILASLLMPMLQKAVESGRSTQCQSNLKQIAQAIFSYADDNGGYVPSVSYTRYLYFEYPAPLNWTVNATPGSGDGAGLLAYLNKGLYLPGFVRNSMSERPITTCPTFWPEVPVTKNWGGSPANAAYVKGGTYSFNTHVDRSLCSSSAPPRLVRKYFSLPRPSQRFVYGEGAWQQCRVFATSEDLAPDGALWYGHNGNTNMQFADGHVESRPVDRVAISTTWPTQASGADTTLGSPW